RPPPNSPAELRVNVLPTTLAEPLMFARPPPLRPAELPVKVLASTLALAFVPLKRPPPSLEAELPVKVVPVTLAVACSELSKPPPTMGELLVNLLPDTLAEASATPKTL